MESHNATAAQPLVNWFDIAVSDFDASVQFYEAVVNVTLAREELPTLKMAMFPQVEGQVSGCLYEDANVAASCAGVLLYFNVNGRLADALACATKCGGVVAEEKMAIGPHGWRAVVLDPDGHRIALHSYVDS